MNLGLTAFLVPGTLRVGLAAPDLLPHDPIILPLDLGLDHIEVVSLWVIELERRGQLQPRPPTPAPRGEGVVAEHFFRQGGGLHLNSHLVEAVFELLPPAPPELFPRGEDPALGVLVRVAVM